MNPTSLPLIDFVKPVMGCAPAALATTAGDGDYVSMKNHRRLTVLISILNATTVTGGAVTLKQATSVAGGSEKALAFSKAYRDIDTDAGDTIAEFTVSSDTFTTDTTNSKKLLYVIEVDAATLDLDNGFDCVRVDVASMANAVGTAVYLLHGSRNLPSIAQAAITD